MFASHSYSQCSWEVQFSLALEIYLASKACLLFSEIWALLSVSTEWAARVNLISLEADWKDWQIYSVLLTMIIISGILFYIFFEYSDSFWNFPLGREQPARPPIEAILGDRVSPDDPGIW
eukprot:Gb_20318 [translate_table: standard]